MTPSLQALATANPPFYTTQKDAYEFFSAKFDLDPATDQLYRRLLLASPIRGRFIGIDKMSDAGETDPDRLNVRFLKYARRTAAAAARKAMDQARLSARDIGVLVVNTCTGYLCPGLTSYLTEDLGLGADIRTLDIAGMGCGGALPNLQAASGLLALDAERPILSIAVEICSATLFMGPDPAQSLEKAHQLLRAAAGELHRGERPQELQRNAVRRLDLLAHPGTGAVHLR